MVLTKRTVTSMPRVLTLDLEPINVLAIKDILEMEKLVQVRKLDILIIYILICSNINYSKHLLV